MHLTELIPILQVSIAPVILISGVGLLLLSMTNRLGRVIDRSRALADALHRADEAQSKPLVAQLQILSQRAQLIRLAITLAILSVLLAAVLIISLFLAVMLKLEFVELVVGLFITCMGCLIASLVVFLMDINLSLAALKLEIKSAD